MLPLWDLAQLIVRYYLEREDVSPEYQGPGDLFYSKGDTPLLSSEQIV